MQCFTSAANVFYVVYVVRPFKLAFSCLCHTAVKCVVPTRNSQLDYTKTFLI